MENTENDNPAMSSESPAESGSELRYLLSAYLFDSLSEEGRTEVERQLERSESCRRELDELKATLELVADVLVSETDDSSSYSFEHRRMERVLSAKKKIRLLRIRFPSRRLAAVAAALLLASVTAFVFLANRGLDTLEMAADGKMENRSIFSGGAPTLDGRIGGLAPRHGSASPVSAEPESDKSRSLRRQEKPVYRNAAERSTARPAAGEDVAFDEGEVEEDAGEDLDEAAEEHPQAASKTEQKKRTASSRKMLTERMRKPAAAARPPPPAAPRRPRGQAAAPSTPGRSKNSPSKREGQSAVVDAIGIGGGAAGGYGNRYGKGGLVKEKAKFGAASIEENLKQGVKLPKTSLAQKEGEAADGISSTAGRLNSRERHVQQRKLQPLGKTSLDRRDRTALDLHATLPRPIKEPIIKRKIDAPAAEHGPVNETRDASKVLQEEGRSLSAGRDARKANNGGRKGAAGKALFFEQLGNSNKQNDGSNQWHAQQNYDLNIKNTDEGYFSLGLDSLSRESKSQLRPGPGDARVQTINEQVLNNFAFYKQLDPNLSYDQFDSRALVIPPPALGDEGLGEKGFRARYGVNPFVATCRDHLSTFGMDVDTASWGRARESIRNKKLPPPQTIRVEEFINNFSDERPGNPNAVFSVYTEGGPSPFGDHGLELIQITLKSRELRAGERKDAILTFAVDTSGSMAADGKIDLLKKSIRTLVDKLAPADRVAIIAFATNAYVVLPHTPVRQKAEILGAIESLTPIGGTNVEAGIDLAYRLAGESSHKRAANRVILCSDGVANLGARGPEMILKKIARFASEDRIALYTYAFGSGGRQAVRGDKMLQQLANRGDGRYQYVDSGSAATKIFSVPDELQVLAADAKIQVNFHPDVVSHYRLLGYEKRDIADKDFRNDKIDAGEVGPGSTVTALYEIKRSRPVGSIGRIYLRYKDAVSSTVEEFNYELHPGVLAGGSRDTSDRFRFIASVAEFAELLRGSYYARNGSFGATLQLMSGVSIDFKKRSDWKEAYRSISAAQGLSAVQTLNSIR
jgi:Ca-activated chloride channel family protein